MKRHFVLKTLSLLTLGGALASPTFSGGNAQAQLRTERAPIVIARPGQIRPQTSLPVTPPVPPAPPGGNWRNGQRVTVSGTVTRSSTGDRFRMRDTKTRRQYTVRYSRKFKKGDKVTVKGVWQTNLIRATQVRKRGSSTPTSPVIANGTRLMVRGTVTSGSDTGQWRLRDANDNREYTIRSSGRTVTGQHLLVEGVWQNGIIQASKVDKWDGSNSGGGWTEGGNNNGPVISITATVIQGSDTGSYRVRADGTGQVYNVKSSGRTVNGQRLKIRGNLRNGILYATSVDKA
jgi:hypothetical protein